MYQNVDFQEDIAASRGSGSLDWIKIMESINSNCMVKGFRDAVSQDSKLLDSIKAYKMGMAKRLILAAFKKVINNPIKNKSKPIRPVSNQNVK